MSTTIPNRQHQAKPMKTRITQITIMPDNPDLEDPIVIEISNAGNGEEYLTVQQGPSDSFRGVSLQITEINWPHIRAGIDTMIGLCNVPEEEKEPKVDSVFAKTEE